MKKNQRTPWGVSASVCVAMLITASAQAESDVPVGGLEVNLRSAQNFSAADIAKVNQAFVVLTRVLNSVEFRDFVLSYNYLNTGGFANNGGLSNEQIYNMIQDGKETMIGKVDQTIDLDLILYNPPWYKRWSVVGYTYPNTTRIWMNRNYFNSYQPQSVAANIAHEWMHKVGFEHDYKSTKRRPYSVPYAVGNFVSKFGAITP